MQKTKEITNYEFSKNREFEEIIFDITNNETVQKMKNYKKSIK